MTPSLPIGTTVIYNGYAYRFCGITPTSIQPTMAILEDPRTGARSDVPVVQLNPSTQSRRVIDHGNGPHRPLH